MPNDTFHVKHGPASGTTIELGQLPLVIGRESDAGERGEGLAGDLELSRRHAKISRPDDQLTIEDLGSRNGTFVNDRRITAPTPLHPGDQIRLGTSELLLQADSADTRLSHATPELAGAAAGSDATVARPVDPERTVARATQPDSERTAARATQPDSERTAARAAQPDSERTVARAAQPDSERTVARATQPAPERTVVRSAQPSSGRRAASRDGAGARSAPPDSGVLAGIVNLSGRRPGRLLGGIGVFVIVAIVFGAPVAGMLKANDPFNNPSSQTVQVKKLIGQGSGELPGAQIIALVTPPGGVRAPGTKALVGSIARKIRSDPAVARTLTYYTTRSRGFVSRDGRSTFVAAYFRNLPDSKSDDAAGRIITQVEKAPEVLVGGPAAVGNQLGSQVGKDLGMSEGIAFPILFILSLFVFRGVIAALMPLFVGGITVMTTFLVLRVVNSFLSLSTFALNIVIGLGLGLAIDYSLFIVSRYREELARTPPDQRTREVYHEALRRSIFTAGRTITFSAITVALAMASLCVLPLPFMYSMGLGGAVTALVALTTALIALPALLAVLGPRINSLAPARWQRAAERTAGGEYQGAWYKLTRFVMKRPVIVALASAAVLIAAGIPATAIKFIGVDAGGLPTKLTARQVDNALQTRFASNGSSAITAVVKAPPTDAGQIRTLAGQLRHLPGAVDTGTAPVALRNGYFTFQILPRQQPDTTSTINLVKAIRAHQSPQVLVTGSTASFLDQKASISSKLWLILTILCVLTAVVLFVMTGSVVLPIKSLIMNFLSLAAAFGLLVLIFQKGNLQGVLNFKSLGAIDISQPILIFAVAFGLASDYGVFLLTRIKEARDAGASDSEAVAIGLERTGRIVTQAAVLFCVAIGAFSISDIVFIKEVGVGTALAVIIDATIIRALLVPSLMALLGGRNWWAPAPLRRLHRRIGLSEG